MTNSNHWRTSSWIALAALVLTVVLVLVWLTRPAAIEDVPRTSAEELIRSALVEELAASDDIRRVEVATDSIEDVGAAAPLDPALGRVVVVHDGNDEPWPGDGCLCFTERVPGELPRTHHVPIERGGFELPEIPSNAVWTLEHGVLGKGAEAGAVQPAAPLEIVGGADTSPREVRLEEFVEVEFDVLSGTNLDQLEFNIAGRAALSEVADVQFIGRTTGGGDVVLTSHESDSRHRVEVPWTCESVRIDAPGHIGVRRAAPSGCGMASTVVLGPSQMIEVRCLGLDPERDYELLIGDVFDKSERHALQRGAEVLASIETADRPILIALCEIGRDEALDSTCVVEGVGTRAVVLRPGRRPETVDATLEVQVRGVGAADVQVMVSSVSLVEFNGPVRFKSSKKVRVLESQADKDCASAVHHVPPGLVRVRRVQDLHSGATHALDSGEYCVVELFAPEFVEATVRCVDAATGDLFPADMLAWFSDTSGAMWVTPPSGFQASTFDARVLRGDLRVTVMHQDQYGQQQSPLLGPFHVEGGETIDLVVDRERLAWSFTIDGKLLRPDAIEKEIAVFENGEGEALPVQKRESIERDSAVGSHVLLEATIATTCSVVYIVPPRHPQFGALACGWVACVPGETAQFEFVPATVN